MKSTEFIREAKTTKKEVEENSVGPIATAPTGGAKAGSLFGGNYQQRNNPFRKKGKKK